MADAPSPLVVRKPRHTIASLGLLLDQTKEILPNPAAWASTPLPSLQQEVQAVAAHPTPGTSMATRNYIMRARAREVKMRKMADNKRMMAAAVAADDALGEAVEAARQAKLAAFEAGRISASLSDAYEEAKNLLYTQVRLWLAGEEHNGERVNIDQARRAAKDLCNLVVKLGGPIAPEDASEAQSVVFDEAVKSIRSRLATRIVSLLPPEGTA